MKPYIVVLSTKFKLNLFILDEQLSPHFGKGFPDILKEVLVVIVKINNKQIQM